MEKSVLLPEGRIRRFTYWSRAIVSIAILIFMFFLARWAKDWIMTLVFTFTVILTNIFMWIQAVKRMQDVNKPGWYFLIPIYGFLLLLAPGTVGPNPYGDDPKNDEGILGTQKNQKQNPPPW